MTPGQALAAVSVFVSLCVAVYALRRDRRAAAVALGLAACVVIARLFKATLPEELHLIGIAGLLVSFGSWAVRRKPVAGALIVASGLCYMLVEYSGSSTTYGVPLMILADIAGYGALFVLFLGGRGGGRADLAEAASVGRGDYRRPDGSCACGGMDMRAQETKG